MSLRKGDMTGTDPLLTDLYQLDDCSNQGRATHFGVTVQRMPSDVWDKASSLTTKTRLD